MSKGDAHDASGRPRDKSKAGRKQRSGRRRRKAGERSVPEPPAEPPAERLGNPPAEPSALSVVAAGAADPQVAVHHLVTSAAQLILAHWSTLATGAVNLLALMLFSRYLIDLTGAALWLPGSLRQLATVLGGLAGFGAMKHARLTSPISVWRVEHLEDSKTAKTAKTAMTGGAATATGEASGAERGRDRKRLKRQRRLARSRLRAQVSSGNRALLTAVAAGLVFAVFIDLREQTVVRWDPPDWLVEDQSWERIQSMETVSEHVRLERHDGLVSADVFVPLWFSEPTQRVIDKRAETQDALTSLLDENYEEFIGWLEGRDRRHVARTLMLTFLLYLLVMVCGSAAWGHGWSTVEELASFLNED